MVKAQETKPVNKESQFALIMASLDTMSETAELKSSQKMKQAGHWP